MSTFTVIPFPQYAFNPVHLSWSFAFFPFAGLVGAVANVFDLPANHRVEVIGGVLQERCGDVLRDFFAKRRRDKSFDETD
jgi:hypothetical protein